MFKTLKQGENFKKNQNKYKNLIKQSNLALISTGKINIVNNLKYGNYSNISEGFDGSQSAEPNAMQKINLAELKKLRELETKFNSDMNEYKEKYQKYLETLASRQGSVNTKYRNKVVRYGANKFYVNNMGTARIFSTMAWQQKDTSCPEMSSTLSAAEYSRLSRGTPMGIGEICRSGGWNAMDSGTGTTAWVDNQGFKHKYNNFRDRNSTCPASYDRITSKQFHAIPTGKAYYNGDKCEVVSLDSPLYTQLQALNNSLMNTVITMKNEVDRLGLKDKSLEKRINVEKKTLLDKMLLLKQEKEKVKKLKTAVLSYKAEAEDQSLSVPSIQMHHFIWAIVGLTFGVVAINIMNKN